MLWVMRAGQKAIYFDKFMNDSKIYLPWEGYHFPLDCYNDVADFRKIVIAERNPDNRTTISNWSGQLFSFVCGMKLGDYVLIPEKLSHSYCLAKVSGTYQFVQDDVDGLFHARPIETVAESIPRDIFSRSIQYSLGAFRTIFKVKSEDEVITTISAWKEMKL